ncbi:MAG: PAS-domain containing protein [Alphaproteobacteria bacterium]
MTRDVFFLAAVLLGVLGPLIVLALVCRRRRGVAPRDARSAVVEAATVDEVFRDTGAGIAIFDAHERLVLATTRYAELFGVALDDLPPAAPLSVLLQTIAYRGDAADAVGREATWIEESLHAHRRGAGPALQRGRGNGWLCLSIGNTDKGGRVHVVTDVSALGQVRRQVAEEVRRLGRQGAFDPVKALANAPGPARQALCEITAELGQRVEALVTALNRLEPANDAGDATASDGLREAVGAMSRLADRYASVERLAKSA